MKPGKNLDKTTREGGKEKGEGRETGWEGEGREGKVEGKGEGGGRQEGRGGGRGRTENMHFATLLAN